MNIQQKLKSESFENFVSKLSVENSNEILRKIDQCVAIPEGEFPYELLIGKMILHPELVEAIVEVFKKVLHHKGAMKVDQNPTLMRQVIISRLEIFIISIRKQSSDYQVLNLLKLVQKLFENALLTKSCIESIIDRLKTYERNGNFARPYLLILEKIAEYSENGKSNNSNNFDVNNNEMSSSGEWSDMNSDFTANGLSR